MLNRNLPIGIYLAIESTDMRKSIDGLAGIVQESFGLNPFEPSLFVFCNKGRNKVKILHYEHNGFWLYYKRLEKGTFKWPKSFEGNTLKVGMRELGWLLDGLNLSQPKAHKRVLAEAII
jgi:transposase